MVPFSAVFFVLKVAFWLFLLTVAGLFIFALICETIESIRRGNRKSGRIAAEAPPATSMSEGTIGPGFVRRLRHSLLP